MLQYALFGFVFFSALVAFNNWRLGLLLCVIAALLQDPVRKATPETPVYLTIAFIPIYVAMAVNLASTVNVQAVLVRYFPRLSVPALLCGACLLISTAITLSYGSGAVTVSLIGLFSYLGVLPAFLLGFFLLRRDFQELDKPLAIFAVISSLMLVGVLLEYLGYKFSLPVLGMMNANAGENRRWFNQTQWVEMLTGFHRSPETMGWHAAVLVIICVYLLTRRPQWLPLWVILGTEGVLCALLSGRRKALVVVVVFLLGFIVFSQGWYRQRLLICLVVACVLVIPLFGFLADDRYVETAGSSFNGAGSRLSVSAVEMPIFLLPQVGPFGFGVGTRSTGAQHFQTLDVQIPYAEGGIPKILVELGFLGTLSLALLLASIIRYVVKCMKVVRTTQLLQSAPVALLAFCIGNVMAFIINSALFGDPFVVMVVGLSGGLLLSTLRLAEQARRAQARPRAPATQVAPRRQPATTASS